MLFRTLSNHWRAAAAVAGLMLVPALWTGSARGQPVAVTDDRGRLVRLQRPAHRIVTLAPHLTELVYAAGAGKQLAGVARYSNHPPEARLLPVVGDAAHFDLERMLALKPDLVLAWRSGTPPETVARLERIGLTVFVAEARRLEHIARDIGAIAELAGTREAGAAARVAFEEALRTMRARRPGGVPVRVFYEIWPRPLMTVNNAHIIGEIISLCGGVNIFGSLQPLTPVVTPEALLEGRPEVALGGGSAENASGFAARWAALPPPLGAVPAFHIAPDLIQRPTPRLLEGARQVCAALDAGRMSRR